MIISDKEIKKPINVLIENIQEIIAVTEDVLKLLEDTVKECVLIENIEKGCEISITLVDNKKIHEINLEFRQVDAPTDVLSFPIVEMDEGRIISEEGDFNLDENLLILGDIVISLEKAEKQAAEYGHSFERELAFLTSHGVFHLLGYDHNTKDMEERMLGKQEEVLIKMRLNRK